MYTKGNLVFLFLSATSNKRQIVVSVEYNSMSNMTVTGSIPLLVDINPRGYHPLSNQSLDGIVRLVVTHG